MENLKTCRRGHNYAATTRDCPECRRIVGRAYRAANLDKHRAQQREWRKKNRARLRLQERGSEKRRARRRARRLENLEKERAYQRAWRAAHPEKAKAWRATNIERVRARDRARRNPEKANAASRAWAARNAEAERARVKAYQAAHPDMARESNHRRRARKFGRYYVRIMRAHLQFLREAQDHCCRYCHRPLVKGATHLDHRIPLVRGGAHAPDNVCLSCASCNLRKHAMTETEFLARIA